MKLKVALIIDALAILAVLLAGCCCVPCSQIERTQGGTQHKHRVSYIAPMDTAALQAQVRVRIEDWEKRGMLK